jgi:hypothetical protein
VLVRFDHVASFIVNESPRHLSGCRTSRIRLRPAFDAVEMQSFLDVHAQIYLEGGQVGWQCAQE